MIAALIRLIRGLRLTVAQYISLHLIAGMVISILSLIAFASIADEVGEPEFMVALDTALANELYASATPERTHLFYTISLLGNEGLVLVLVLVTVYLGLRQAWLYLTVWLGGVVGGLGLNVVLKEIFERPRPVFETLLVEEAHYAFPSGHAMNSLITYGLLAYFIILNIENRIARIFIAFAAVLLIVLIGISRLYLGVHYLSDVIGGYAAGLVWLATSITALEVVRRYRQIKGQGTHVTPPAEV